MSLYLSRYNSYVVALANHVISMWFIRCRIQYRPTIAKFINKVCCGYIMYFNELVFPSVSHNSTIS